MTCAENERLFDAYLDGQLTGTLRLEFEAHRLRCRRCQQTLAMLEAIGHVVAMDQREPRVSESFTDHVMGDIAHREAERARPLRIRATRAAIVIGGLLQAAAVLLLAIMLQNKPASEARNDGGVNQAGGGSGIDLTARDGEANLAAVLERQIESQVVSRLLAAVELTERQKRMLAYFNLDVPDPVARATSETFNPLTGWLYMILPQTEDVDASEAASDQFAL